MASDISDDKFNENIFHFKDEQGEFTLTRDDMHVIACVDGSYGFKPGSFTTALINLVFKADFQNFAKLSSQFPSVCKSVISWKTGDLPERMERAKKLAKLLQNSSE